MKTNRKPSINFKCSNCKDKFSMFHCDITPTIETRGVYRKTCKKCGILLNLKKTGIKFYCEPVPVIDRKLLKAKPTEKGYRCNIPDLSKYTFISGFKGCLVNEPKFI